MILVLIIVANAICAYRVIVAWERRDEPEPFEFDMGDLLISRSEMNRRAGKLFKEAKRWNRMNSSRWR